MPDIAIIGGTGLARLEALEVTRREVVTTPWGEPSGPLTYGRLYDRDVVFLARHGYAHTIPPHRVNYRANVWALKQTGVERTLAVASVGGIHHELAPGRLAFPHQLVDYTWGRKHTYFEEDLERVTHVDFTVPYDTELRERLIGAARAAGVDAAEGGVYGAAQGPRLETAAEIDRMERDGCTMVGMTGMPEAALARELDLGYACCAVVANWAAGRGDVAAGDIHAQIERHIATGMDAVRRLLEELLPSL